MTAKSTTPGAAGRAAAPAPDDLGSLDDPAAAVLAGAVALDRDTAESLADALRHAGALLSALSDDPAAQAAHLDLDPDADGLDAFALDLLVAAEEITGDPP
jgi:hypothetical protein